MVTDRSLALLENALVPLINDRKSAALYSFAVSSSRLLMNLARFRKPPKLCKARGTGERSNSASGEDLVISSDS